MRRTLKILTAVMAVLLLTPIAALAVYDLAVFQPHRARIQALLDAAAPDEKSPPPAMKQLLRTEYRPPYADLSAPVSRQVIQDVGAARSGSNLRWHFTSALWQMLVALHYSKDEQATLFLTLSPMGQDARGFSHAAPALVGVPLKEVTLDQAARLLAVSRSPAYVPNSPERWTRMANALAARARQRSPE